MPGLFGDLPEYETPISEAAAKLLAELTAPDVVSLWILPEHEAAARELQRRGKARLRWTGDGWRELRPTPAPA